jgi:integrase
LAKLGIPRGGFHSMRHGAASALLSDGANMAVVQRQLRHSDPRITLGIYSHVIGDDQRSAVQTLGETGELGPIVRKLSFVRKRKIKS